MADWSWFRSPDELVPAMSLLDESLSRSLESVRRAAESPLVQSLRLEVAGLTERLKVLQQTYDSRRLEMARLYEQQRYRVTVDQVVEQMKTLRPTGVRVEVQRTPSPYGRLVFTARMMVDDLLFRDACSEADLRHEIAGMLAGQLAKEVYLPGYPLRAPRPRIMLAKEVYSSQIPPERPERAQDPSKGTKVTHDSGTPLPGYPLRDTRPPREEPA